MRKKENKKGTAGKILSIIIVLILIVLILVLSYFLYLNIPREPENLNVEIEKPEYITDSSLSSEVKQFYPEMKFNHNKITYKIGTGCSDEKKQRMLKAFDILSEKVRYLTFEPSLNNPDIEISCNKKTKENIEDKHFIAGEGGAKEIIKTNRYNIITNGVIYLYDDPDFKTIDCEYPNVEMHELMHVFGFDHTSDKESLMFPLLDSCDQTLDYTIISKLISLYAQPNLPDLYFEDIKVVKKGRYLDFNLTIRNSGLIDAEETNIVILEDLKKIDQREINSLNFGAGISLQTTNLKLNSLNPKEIRFIIDMENKIIEIDKNNNIAKIKL
ncbi:MAG: matrixin family metalloprotease [archaeon]